MTRPHPAETTVPAWIAAAIIVIALVVGVGFILYTLQTSDAAQQHVIAPEESRDAPPQAPAREPKPASASPTPPPSAQPAPPRARAEVYVLGEVPKPGVYALKNDKTTVKQLLLLAGVKPEDKSERKVDLARAVEGKTKHILEDVPMGSILKGLNDDVVVRANDKIMVAWSGP